MKLLLSFILFLSTATILPVETKLVFGGVIVKHEFLVGEVKWTVFHKYISRTEELITCRHRKLKDKEHFFCDDKLSEDKKGQRKCAKTLFKSFKYQFEQSAQ